MGALPVTPVCIKCKCFFFPKKNGFMFLEGMPRYTSGLDPEDYRGNRMPDVWEPYKLWVGDLWECKDCGHQIIKGCANDRIAEHYEPDFKSKVERYGGSQFQVNDC